MEFVLEFESERGGLDFYNGKEEEEEEESLKEIWHVFFAGERSTILVLQFIFLF